MGLLAERVARGGAVLLVMGALGGLACAMDNPAFGHGGSEGGDGSGEGDGDGTTSRAESSEGGEESTAGGGEGETGDTGLADTTGDDEGLDDEGSTSDTGDELERVRCEGVLWAINEDGIVQLVDVIEGESTVTANVGFSSFAAATLRSGALVVVEAGNLPDVIAVDPTTGEALEELLTAVPANNQTSRAAFHPSGTLWIATFGDMKNGSQIMQLEPEREPATVGWLEELPGGGDHMFVDDATMLVVGWEGSLAVVDIEPVLEIRTTAVLGAVGQLWSGISFTDGSLWVANRSGRVFELVVNDMLDDFGLGESFQAAEPIDDLAPVFLDKRDCPHGWVPG